MLPWKIATIVPLLWKIIIGQCECMCVHVCVIVYLCVGKERCSYGWRCHCKKLLGFRCCPLYVIQSANFEFDRLSLRVGDDSSDFQWISTVHSDFQWLWTFAYKFSKKMPFSNEAVFSRTKKGGIVCIKVEASNTKLQYNLFAQLRSNFWQNIWHFTLDYQYLTSYGDCRQWIQSFNNKSIDM